MSCLQDYQHSCEGKIRFETAWEADVAARMYEGMLWERMLYYPCWYCGHWHIGHDRPSPKYILAWAFRRAAHFLFTAHHLKNIIY